MILEHKILVHGQPERLFQFFEDMEMNYTHWHPDHHHFEWRKGRGCLEGNVFFFDETIAGQRQPKEVVFTRVEPDRMIEFAPTNRFFRLFLPSIMFEFQPEGDHTWLVARIALRMGPVARWLHRKEFELVRKHMREEGENLKLMVEAKAAA